MASRTQRRRNQKTSDEKITALEKKRNSNPVMWVVSILILVVIIVTFIGAPIAGKASSRGNLVFGSYDGKDIVYYEGSYFSDQVNSIAENYRDQLNSDNAYFIQYQVWRTAFDNTAYRTAAIQEVKSSGCIISSGAVDEAIVTYGPYMENGEFSDNMYAQSSNTEKLNVRERFRDDLYYSKFATDINSNPVNNNEGEFLKNFAKTEKIFKYTVFPFSSFPDEKVAEYGSANSELFQSIMLSKITINSSRKDAEQVYAKLQAEPGMFGELAKTQSSDPYAEKGGEMGSRYYYEMKNLISDEGALKDIFSLKNGEISQIVEGDNSWEIYRCDKTPEYSDMTLESDLTVVKDYMELYAKGDIEDYLVENANSFADFARNGGFDKAAADYSYNVYETNSFPIVYGNPSVYYYGQQIPIFNQVKPADGADLSGFSTNEFVLKSIDALAPEEISEGLILNDSVVVFQLIDTVEKTSDELDSIPTMVTFASQDWVGTQFKEFVYASDKFHDNFSQTFSKVFTFK